MILWVPDGSDLAVVTLSRVRWMKRKGQWPEITEVRPEGTKAIYPTSIDAPRLQPVGLRISRIASSPP